MARGIFQPQGRGRHIGKVGCNQNRGGVCGPGQVRVFRISNEAELPKLGFFDAGYTGDFEIGVAAQLSLEHARQLGGLHEAIVRKAGNGQQAVGTRHQATGSRQ